MIKIKYSKEMEIVNIFATGERKIDIISLNF